MTINLNRRDVIALTAMAAAGQSLPTQAQDRESSTHFRRMMRIPADAPKIGMLVYPRMVALDLMGSMTVFNIMRGNVQLIWKDKDPVSTDVGIPISATTDFATCPLDLDVLFVPGGIMGTIDCMGNPEVLDFLADRGSRAKWVTSVCTGSLILGAAGLLDGYRATSHWAVADLLPTLGATPSTDRVVTDRNRMTGGGVTAGIDFGLSLAKEMTDEETARRIQLIMEYSPQPPFENGTPEEAGPERTAVARSRRTWMDRKAREAAEAAAMRLQLARSS